MSTHRTIPLIAEAPDRAQPSRRALLQWLAASAALSLAGCVRRPAERIYSFAQLPEIEASGQPLYYASACTVAGHARPVLVGTQQGRPIKVEGHPGHPASSGGTGLAEQAAILDLWDPDRSTSVWRRAAPGRDEPSSWAAFLQAWRAQPAAAPLHVLTPAFTSPTLAAQLAALLKQRPGSRWYRDDDAALLAARHGSRLAFNREVRTVARIEAAELVIAVGGDPFGDPVAGPRQSAGWARSRRDGARPRLLALETTPGLFGARADERWALTPLEIEAVLWQAGCALLQEPRDDEPALAAARRIAALLRRHRGRALVLAGPELSASSHALVHALNQAVSSERIIHAIEPPDLHADLLPAPGTLAELTAAAQAGQVPALLVLGGNPAYEAPASLRFEAALAHVPLSLHLGLHRDETARLCHWHLPCGHDFEEWGDTRADDGTLTLQQPAIAPLYDTHSPIELLTLLANPRAAADGHALLRAQWAGLDWPAALARGFVPDTAAAPLRLPPVPMPPPPHAPANAPAHTQAPAQLWAVFPPDPCIGHGGAANNGWLQELPRPFTQIAWGNALQVGPHTAAVLNLATGDIVEAQGLAAARYPVWVQPGHAEGAVTIHSGHGRRAAGSVGTGVGVDNAPLRSADTAVQALVLRRVGSGHEFALTQVELSQHGRELARTMPMPPAEPPAPTLYPPMPQSGPAWGMAIDLDACIGCKVCTVACQAENNIPVVGPDEVRRGRAMHWIRVDAYLDDDGGQALSQPVPCMHCENAPCELVCPVGATMHDSEGLNVQVYNRCVGTRFCSNNCPYKVRRFNFRQYNDLRTETLKLMRNPDVTVRDRGVMEKCSYCVQRLSRARRHQEKTGEALPRDTVRTACQAACPTAAITFGDLNDPQSAVSQARASPRHYRMLEELNTRPRTGYLARRAPLPPEDDA
ncbi:4Fe-4S dicluster domain-containing protein [Paucibacter sp. R3-3]|uniref:4Fe-4S dicluster domain-containing protein n=1 Tax=Roseateles agri TaxID=3098619 RepID=A0ABU5DN27_9BURK|nr:4Fe-4S dicluster domain-containing protein [Paucibacter sp. R3-3]MDY0747711.1 4Fe-4S dicluster domain-containing protein [Paucibacter sp. R3-3]